MWTVNQHPGLLTLVLVDEMKQKNTTKMKLATRKLDERNKMGGLGQTILATLYSSILAPECNNDLKNPDKYG